jgi:cellulose synthase/poly-beta-1,6-N-acetylglucosamine synthase-like glycosyltransferase
VADDVLSIIVPVKDEAATLAHLITSVEEAEVPGMQKQILVVDDGSSDDTPRWSSPSGPAEPGPSTAAASRGA